MLFSCLAAPLLRSTILTPLAEAGTRWGWALRLLPCSAATTIFLTKKLLGDRNEGSTTALEENEVPYVPSFIRKCMTRDGKTYLNLQPPTTLTCRGWTSVSPTLSKLGLPGLGHWLVLFLPNSSAEILTCPANQKGQGRNREMHTQPLS